MARPKGSKNKPVEGTIHLAPEDRSQFAEVASIKDVSPGDTSLLNKRIADLESKLAASEEARSEAEKQALRSAEAQGMLMQREIEEVPTGRSVTVKRLDQANPYKVVGHKDDGRDILRPNLVNVQIPTFFYKIDLPPCGGTDYKINGVEFYHGGVYELDRDTLRSVKEIVYRCWKHDSTIHGNDENFYRPKQNNVLSGMRAR